MAESNRGFTLVRAVFLYFTTLASVLVLFISSFLVAFGTFGDELGYAWLAMISATLTLALIPLMLFFSIYRKGAFTSMIVVELIVTGVLWGLWLASSGAIKGNQTLQLDCRDASYYYSSRGVRVCVQIDVLTAFSFVNGIIFLGLNVTLLVLALIQKKRGNNIWTAYVTEVDLFAPAPAQEATDATAPQAYGDGANPPIPQPIPTQQVPEYISEQLRFSQYSQAQTQPQPHYPPVMQVMRV